MMNINNDKKIDILLSALEERYTSIHNIRDRVQNTGIWILGILSSISGWIFQSGINLPCSQKIFLIAGVAIAFIAIRFSYLKDLNKGFKSQLMMAAKLEKTLGFYEPSFFNTNQESMYPKSWENAGSEKGEGNFFASTYLLIYFGFLFLILSLAMA